MRSRWKGPKMSDAPHAAASTGGIPKPSYLEGYIKAAVAVKKKKGSCRCKASTQERVKRDLAERQQRPRTEAKGT